MKKVIQSLNGSRKPKINEFVGILYLDVNNGIECDDDAGSVWVCSVSKHINRRRRKKMHMHTHWLRHLPLYM